MLVMTFEYEYRASNIVIPVTIFFLVMERNVILPVKKQRIYYPRCESSEIHFPISDKRQTFPQGTKNLLSSFLNQATICFPVGKNRQTLPQGAKNL